MSHAVSLGEDPSVHLVLRQASLLAAAGHGGGPAEGH